MIIKEKLTWIIDKYPDKCNDEYQKNIDFVHSLGKKCDSVGWSELDIDEPDANEVLDKIQYFCKKNGYYARGCYERTYTDITSDWYELKTDSFKDNTIHEIITVSGENDEETDLEIINAYRELSPSPKKWYNICVPERFRNACIKNNITDVDFCWVQDKGKYNSEQYFYIYPKNNIPQIACDKGLNKQQTSYLHALGGYLPKIASIFYNLQYISLQDCYLRKDMPEGGIACVYISADDNFSGRYKILIHKDTAEILIKQKAVSVTSLTPVFIADKCPDGYSLVKTENKPIPSRKYIDNCFTKYNSLKEKDRPEYLIKEKEALKYMRKAKISRKSDFNKKINKKYAEEISNTLYNTVLPYYQVCDGCFLSDEYEFLSYNESNEISKDFFEKLKNEELSTTEPDGVVIAVCPDGDVVIITKNEEVLRFSHETPEIICKWKNIHMFIVDAINNSE